MESDKPVVAAFDFDGTVTRSDTMFRFLLHVVGPAMFSRNLLALAPTLAGYGLGLVRNDIAKERAFTRFLGRTNIHGLQPKAEQFAAQKLPRLIRSEALRRIEWHKEQGHRCVLISASLDIYLQPWARQAGFDHVIASQLETLGDGRITGNLLGANCFGAEKIRRLNNLMGDRDQYILYAYGDSRGDRELLAAADYAYYREMPHQ